MSQPIPGPLVFDTRSSTASRAIFAGLPVGMDNLIDWTIDYDDFQHPVIDGTNEWVKIVDTNVTILSANDVQHGVAVITNVDAADNAGGSIQRSAETFKFEAGKKLIFEARFKTTDADDVDLAIGLAERHATNPEALILGAGVWLQVNEGNASILCKAGTAGATSEDSGVDLADDTFIRVGFVYDGADTLTYYVNRVARASVNFASLPTALMCVSAYMIQGAGANDTMSIDYLFCAAER